MSSCHRKTKENQHKNRIKTNIYAHLFQISLEIILHALETAVLVSLCLVNSLHRRHTLQSGEIAWGQEPGGGGYSTNVYTGRLRKKGTPFVYLLLTNVTSFKHLVQNYETLLTTVNALSFK